MSKSWSADHSCVQGQPTMLKFHTLFLFSLLIHLNKHTPLLVNPPQLKRNTRFFSAARCDPKTAQKGTHTLLQEKACSTAHHRFAGLQVYSKKLQLLHSSSQVCRFTGLQSKIATATQLITGLQVYRFTVKYCNCYTAHHRFAGLQVKPSVKKCDCYTAQHRFTG